MKYQRKTGIICLFFIVLIAFTNPALASDAIEIGPENEINILSGGSSNLLKSPTVKMAIKYVPPADKTVDKVMLLPGTDFPETNQPLWNVQVQTNSGSYPSGTILGKGTLVNPKDRIWSTIDISPNVALKKGETYWIVVQYLSGPIPTSTNSWLGLYASKPIAGTTGDVYLPYDYNRINQGSNDNISRTNVAYFDGTKWRNDPNGRIIPTFVFQFTDGTYHGQPYRHNYAMIYGTNKVGQVFTNYDQSKMITQISMPWSTFHATDSLVRPKDNLYYYICENNYNGKVVSSGAFLSAADVYISGSGTGVFDRRWYTLTLADPVLLEEDKTYFIYFTSPGSTSTSYWCTDAGNALLEVDQSLQTSLSSVTYDGTSSYVVRTYTTWSNAATDIGRDMTFKFMGYNVEDSEDSSEPIPESSGSGTSFSPSATSLTADVGDSTIFSVTSDEQFTSMQWYVDGSQVSSGTTYVRNWTASGSFDVRFDGVKELGTLSRTWNVVITGPEYSDISIVPSANVVAPGETFSIDVFIDPKQPLTGSQFDLQYGSLSSVASVKDGGMFSTGGLTNTFQSGKIDNSAGILTNVYSAIIGSETVLTPGSIATIDMVAGASRGLMELTLSNVVLSDAYSNPAPYEVSSATVLVDTAPTFSAISAMSVEEESTLTFMVSATDADGDTLTYACTSLPLGATFDASSRTLTWTPSKGQAGSYTAEFEVTDGYLTDTANVIIEVTVMDAAPVITFFEPSSGSQFEEGQTIDLRVAAEDPESKALSYSLTINGMQVSTSTSYQWITDYSSAGIYSIGVTVNDGNSQVSQTHVVTITDVHPRWDINQDGIVNILDITLVGQNYGKIYTGTMLRWDVNQDGVVNIQDMSIVAAHFGETVQ